MLLRQTLMYLPAQLVAPLLAFASVLVWAHLLAPADVGVITLLIAIQEVCHAATFGWWGMYTLRFIAGFTTPGQRSVYLRTERSALLISATLQVLVAVPIVILWFGNSISNTTRELAVAFILTRSLNSYTADRARAETRVTLYTAVQTVGPVIGFALGLILIGAVEASASAVLAGFVTAQLFGIVVGIVMSDLGRGSGRASGAVLRQALAFGGTQTATQLLAILAINAPRFIVSEFLGLAGVGMFSVGFSLGVRASSFAVTLVTAASYPLVVQKMVKEGRDAAFAQLSRNMTLVAMVVTPVAFGLLAINTSLVQLLVASEYRPVTRVVLPLATIAGLFRYLRAHTSDQVFLLNLRPIYGTLIAACDIVVSAVSAYLGIKAFGVVGAALGPMISGVTTFTLSFALSRRRFGYRAPFHTFVRILFAALGMYVIIALLPQATSVPILVMYILIGALLYAGALLTLMPHELRILRSVLRRRLVRRQVSSQIDKDTR